MPYQNYRIATTYTMNSGHLWIVTTILDCYYRAFHRFGQAKFPDGGLIFGFSQFSAASKTMLG